MIPRFTAEDFILAAKTGSDVDRAACPNTAAALAALSEGEK